MENQIYENAKKYLRDPQSVLKELVDPEIGYKSCHHLKSDDVSKCANDCKALEKRKFAKNCSNTGGFFKCCIRRDKRGCHECKFCCTLPMCTYPPGGRDNTVFDEKISLEENQSLLKAKNIFWSHEIIYKNYDYRCVKPYSHKDPKKWHMYDMEPFRHAHNSKVFKLVPSYEPDNKMFNFEDPKVFKRFVKSKGRC